MVGRKFGRWTVLTYDINSKRQARWICQCECSVTRSVFAFSLKNKNLTKASRSCGCLKSDVARELFTGNTYSLTHGKSKTRTFKIWIDMIRRCENPKRNSYHLYGGRGIFVCDRWKIFENFLYDMGECPNGLSIERKNNNEGYCKENCRWANRRDQANNMRSNIFYEYDGENLTLSEISRRCKVHRKTLETRIRRQGLSLKEAINRG